MSAFKCQAMARDLEARLQAMIAGAVITETTDANFMPIIKLVVGSEVQFCKIEVEPDPSGGVDGLGLTQTLYSPSQLTILRDSTISDANARNILLGEAARSGAKLLTYEVDPMPPAYTLSGATLIGSEASNAWNPLTLSE